MVFGGVYTKVHPNILSFSYIEGREEKEREREGEGEGDRGKEKEEREEGGSK